MFKKSFIIAAAIISYNNSYSMYQDGGNQTKHHHQQPHQVHVQLPAQQLTPAQEADVKRLDALEKEEKEQYSRTGYCWAGTAASVLFTAASIALKWDFEWTGAGIFATVGSGGLGIFTMTNENYKAQQRAKERAEISERLSRYNNIIIR